MIFTHQYTEDAIINLLKNRISSFQPQVNNNELVTSLLKFHIFLDLYMTLYLSILRKKNAIFSSHILPFFMGTECHSAKRK
jgi:hypothetical protein